MSSSENEPSVHQPADNSIEATQSNSTGTTLEMKNRSMKEFLVVSLEFKRLLEHIFADQQLLESEEVQKYLKHYQTTHEHFTTCRRTFTDHLARSIERLDSQQLTNCAKMFPNMEPCKLPACIVAREDQRDVGHSHVPAVNKAAQIKTSKDAVSLPSILLPKAPLSRLHSMPTQAASTTVTTVDIAEIINAPAISDPLSMLLHSLEIQAKVQVPRGMITCRVADCATYFLTEAEEGEHFKSHPHLFKCSKCGALYMDKVRLLEHFLVHTTTKK